MSASARTLGLAALAAVLVAALVEGLAFAASFALDDLFDERAPVVARLDATEQAAFAAQFGDPELGWARRGAGAQSEDDCQGRRVTYTYDADGARTYPGFEPAHARVVAVGDSYTFGSEAQDDEAYPARLAAQLGVAVANQGVAGYDPLQSALLLQRKAARYPEAQVAVLAIMYEDLLRLVNRYRPVLHDARMLYAFKPYMADGAVVPHPGARAFGDLAELRRLVDDAYDHDFWARPRLRFPYSLALLRSVTSHAFLLRDLPRELRKRGVPEFGFAFRSEALVREVVAFFGRFAAIAAEHGMRPIVVFLPRSRFDTTSAAGFIEREHARFPAGLTVVDAGTAPIDWDRYNLEVVHGDDHDLCHPSAYGYDAIAAFVADTIRRGGGLPPRR
jgi:lysophospholipase L1-like esterase